MTPLQLLARVLARNGRAVLVLTRFPSGEDLKDGYFQRVGSVDALLAAFTRVYANPDRAHRRLEISRVAEGAFEVRFRPARWTHLAYLALIALASRAVYAHSIYVLANRRVWWLFRLGRKAILDFHGVVPEELALLGDAGEARMSAVEAKAVARADAIASITNAMSEHVRRKYSLRDGAKRFVLLPHLPVRPITGERPRYARSVIYCGGLQKWQQIEKTLAWVRAHRDECRFTFLVPQPEELKRRYRELHGEEFPGLVTSARPDELGRWYVQCSFGLVLREDSVVNRVACPSKMVEYLLHDLVPIVDTENVGDFRALGTRTVARTEPLPDEAAWREMVAGNRQALRTLERTFHAGAAELQRLLGEQP